MKLSQKNWKKIYFSLLLLGLISNPIFSQKNVLNDTLPTHGLIFGVTSTMDIPMADMAQRFGPSYTLGATFMYKTFKNLYLQTYVEFITGNLVKQDSIYKNVGVDNLNLYDANGELKSLILTERGMNIGVSVGRSLYSFHSKKAKNDLMLFGGLSLLQHRINTYDPQKLLIQIQSNYAKGYDHLTNGLAINLNPTYFHQSKRKSTNYQLGINLRYGLTKNRRDFNFDTGTVESYTRNDVMLGFKIAWLFSALRKPLDEIYY